MGHHPRDYSGGRRTESVDSLAEKQLLLALGDQSPFVASKPASRSIDLYVSDSRLIHLHAYDSIPAIGVANLDPGEEMLAYLSSSALATLRSRRLGLSQSVYANCTEWAMTKTQANETIIA